jgi:hypothetical protein
LTFSFNSSALVSICHSVRISSNLLSSTIPSLDGSKFVGSEKGSSVASATLIMKREISEWPHQVMIISVSRYMIAMRIHSSYEYLVYYWWSSLVLELFPVLCSHN